MPFCAICAIFSDPWSLRFAALWIYPVALLGGILRSLSTRRLDKWIGALSLLPSLLYTLLTGGRAAFLLALAFWLAGNWASRVASGENLPRLLTTKTITTFGALAAGLLLMFVVVNSFRGTQESSDPTDVMLEFNSGQIRNYMFGSPAAFSEWFQHRESEPLSWGALSFQGAYDVLRIRPKTLGTYVDSEPTVGLESTNIYTIFRGLIQDFSLLGSFALCVLAGFFSGRAYASRLLGPNRALALSAFYAVTLYSALMNPFAFNSSLLAWVVAWYVLRAKSQYSAPTLFAAD